jgi:hypothetical protein
MYKSPFSVAWRKPIKLDTNDPRAQNPMNLEKYRARAGSEVYEVGEERNLFAPPEYQIEIGNFLAIREWTTVNIYKAVTIVSASFATEYTTVNVL